MSTFYVLPPRPSLGDAVAAFLHAYLPGLDWDAAARVRLADAVGEVALNETEVYVVFRDDLPADATTTQALIDAYGAEAGDEVIEVRPIGRGGVTSACRWRVLANAAA
jgi:hypothetical protein